MKFIFFLIPFLIVAGLGIYQDVSAVESYRGESFLDVTNPDGTHTWTGGLPPYILVGNEYVPFIFSNNTVETNHGSIILNPDGSYSFYKKGIIDDTPLFTDRIVAKYADVSNLNSWTYPDTLNNDVPDVSWNGTAFVSSKVKAGIGQLDYKYIPINGVWKTQLEATNLSTLTTKAFGFDQIIELNRDTISFGGVTRNLDAYNNTTFTKVFLDANKGKILNFLNSVRFDFDLGYDNLYSISVYDTGTNSTRLVFDYRTSAALLPNQTLTIDPEYGYTAGSSDNMSILSTAVCATYNAESAAETAVGSTGSYCFLKYAWWNTTSIPDGATITNSSLILETLSNINTPTIQVVAIKDHPKFVSNSTNWTNIRTNATVYSSFVGAATSYFDLDLGTSADTNAQAALVNDWFGVGYRTDPELMENKYVGISNTNSQLRLTYVPASPPNPITSLTFANLGSNSVDLIYSLPTSNGSGTFQAFVINSTTPWGQPLTFNQNSTQLYANVTGLTFGTDYSFRVALATEVLYNTTGSYILDITTTTSNTYALPPTGFTLTDNHTNTTVLLANWTAPLMNNINGYRLQCEAPVGAGFSTIISNTSTVTANYNYTGLVVNTFYNCKVAALNGTGITSYSNTWSATTHHLSDAVTSLGVTMTNVLSAILTWVQPVTLYGYLTGYQINYTTPAGDPTIIYVATTGSSGLTYTVTGLTSADIYSFRVSAITIHGKNTTLGAITNGTAFSNFDIGSVYLPTGTNPYKVPISFAVIPINTTATTLKVTYDSSYDLACDFSRPIYQSNTTYSGLVENAISGSSVYTNFTLNGYGNDLLDVYCWNQLQNTTNGRERLGTSSIPLVDQIKDFRSGAFGPSGMFGAFDLITLLVVIISMIGFNRNHPVYGVVFMALFIGAMTYYNVIAYQTTILGAIALMVALAIIYGKRDD